MRKKRILFVCSLSLVLVFAAGCAGGGKSAGGNGNNVNDVLQQQMDAQDGKTETETEPETETESQTQAQTQPVGTPPPPEEAKADLSSTEGVDVDLTLLSGTMLYSQVSYMTYRPEEFKGKVVRVPGNFSVAYNWDRTKQYFGCVISDQSACCTLGVEFELPESYTYPDDYPEEDSLITVQGTFDTYEEEGYTYCVLRNATLVG